MTETEPILNVKVLIAIHFSENKDTFNIQEKFTNEQIVKWKWI